MAHLGRSISRGFPEQLLRRVLERRLPPPRFRPIPQSPGRNGILLLLLLLQLLSLLLLLLLLLLSQAYSLRYCLLDHVHARPSRIGSPDGALCGGLPDEGRTPTDASAITLAAPLLANQPRVFSHRWL